MISLEIFLNKGIFMVRTIISSPSPRLFLNSEVVNKFDAELRTLLDDMYKAMIASNGVGFAAC